MQAVVEIALPFFALIFTGYAAGRSRLLAGGTVAGLNTFVFYFALPALLLVKTYEAPEPTGGVGALIAAYYGPALLLFAAVLLAGRWLFHQRIGVASLQALAAVFSNVGFIGLPLTLLLFGGEAALPAVLIVIVDTTVMLGLTTALIEYDLGRGRSTLAVARLVLAGVVGNPIVAAAVIGLALNFLAAPVPEALLAYGGLLADAAGPCALFALGATLAGRPVREGALETVYLSGLKLIVHPALVAIMALWVLELPQVWASVAILQAALPVAANVFVLAQRYELHAGPVSTAIFVSTGFAVITVSFIITWL